MKVIEVQNADEKERISGEILEGLRDWFEVDSAREGYIRESREMPLLAAFEEETPLGFRQFQVIPEIWGAENPCQIYVMAL